MAITSPPEVHFTVQNKLPATRAGLVMSSTIHVEGRTINVTLWNAAKGLSEDGNIRFQIDAKDWESVRDLLVGSVDEAVAELKRIQKAVA